MYLLCAPMVSGVALGVDIRVPEDAPNVAAAIEQAVDGDRIDIAGGQWVGGVSLAGKSVLLRGRSPGRTVLVGPVEGGPVLMCTSGEGAGTVLEDLILRSGTGQPIAGYPRLTIGGGLLCDGGSPTVRRCVFQRNTASLSGGGAYCGNASNVRFEHCTFESNRSEKGGGVSIVGSNVTLVDCIFQANRATYAGGGVLVADGSDASIDGGRFTRNIAGFTGGGVYEYDAHTQIEDAVFDRNRATLRGGAVYFGHLSRGDMERCHFRSPTDEVSGSRRVLDRPAVVGACHLDRWCIQAEETDCLLAGGLYVGDHAECLQETNRQSAVQLGDIDHDGEVNDRDLALLMLLWR
jgi:predicted outer membrane repeat protein